MKQTRSNRKWTLALAVPLAAAAMVCTPAHAADNNPMGAGNTQRTEARDTLQEASRVVERMRADPGLRAHLQRAKGVLIVPNFARGGLGVVAKGGEGVVMTRLPSGEWSNPAFFNMGGLSVGLQAGASAGQVAFLMMSDKAVNAFDSQNNFSLNANAGLSIINYSALGQASAGKGDDVIAWSDTEGLFAGVNIGVTDVVADNEENRALYGPQADAQAILHGRVSNTPPAAMALKQAMAGAGNVSTSGSTTASTSGAPRSGNAVTGGERTSDSLGTGSPSDSARSGSSVDQTPMRSARADRN